MLESYIFRQTYAKFLPKTNSSTDQQIQMKFITRNAAMFSSKCETFAVQVAYAWVPEVFSKWGETSARQKN